MRQSYKKLKAHTRDGIADVGLVERLFTPKRMGLPSLLGRRRQRRGAAGDEPRRGRRSDGLDRRDRAEIGGTRGGRLRGLTDTGRDRARRRLNRGGRGRRRSGDRRGTERPATPVGDLHAAKADQLIVLEGEADATGDDTVHHQAVLLHLDDEGEDVERVGVLPDHVVAATGEVEQERAALRPLGRLLGSGLGGEVAASIGDGLERLAVGDLPLDDHRVEDRLVALGGHRDAERRVGPAELTGAAGDVEAGGELEDELAVGRRDGGRAGRAAGLPRVLVEHRAPGRDEHEPEQREDDDEVERQVPRLHVLVHVRVPFDSRFQPLVGPSAGISAN